MVGRNAHPLKRGVEDPPPGISASHFGTDLLPVSGRTRG